LEEEQYYQRQQAMANFCLSFDRCEGVQNVNKDLYVRIKFLDRILEGKA
jgi:hypothetical protein